MRSQQNDGNANDGNANDGNANDGNANDGNVNDDITIEEALRRASSCLREAGVEHDRFEAELLLAHTCKTDRLQLLIDRGKHLSGKSAAFFFEAIGRRCLAEPSAYITGTKEFYGLPFTVSGHVLIPRPETEHLIEVVLEWVCEQGFPGGAGIEGVDLGTGSGNIAVTLAKLLPEAYFRAVDLYPEALAVASLNAARHGVDSRVRFHRGNYFKAFDVMDLRPGFNLVVSNPPYICKEGMALLPDTIKNYEPLTALDGGSDGLSGYRSILDDLHSFMDQPALVAMEIGAGQERAVTGLFRSSGLFASIKSCRDYQDIPRVICGLA